MQLSTFALATRRLALAAAVAAVGLAATACSDDDNGTGPAIAPDVQPGAAARQSARERGAAVQAEPPDARVDRPRSGRGARGARGRRLPDHRGGPGSGVHPGDRAGADSRRLVVDTSKDPSSPSGWLTWLPQLGGGYGGRKLHGRRRGPGAHRGLRRALGDAAHATPELTTDNVGVRLAQHHQHLPLSRAAELTARGAPGRSGGRTLR